MGNRHYHVRLEESLATMRGLSRRQLVEATRRLEWNEAARTYSPDDSRKMRTLEGLVAGLPGSERAEFFTKLRNHIRRTGA